MAALKAFFCNQFIGGLKKSKFPIYSSYLYETKSSYEPDEKLKIPALRNVALTGPYYHNGAVKTLEEAVVLMGNLQLNKSLSKNEVINIVAFLKSLSAEKLPLKQPRLPTVQTDYSFD